ncbi:high-osmolarity-induced transcription protein 1 [Fusarium flagelliforme]|uniref:High-osmolarity-induced transcription protein 1 n=2 Tax=Fusarium flagelliforme TaxID=2675880 RepID=A0A395MNU0_9HYPO|nr:high-osmolarity-induced transcription protein 1 [Fusarium flagelliforme]
MLLSPTRSPTPSVSEGPLRRSASEPPFGPITPSASQQSLEAAEHQTRPPLSLSRDESIDDAIERVPFNLAQMVVNMQEYYTSELAAERQRTDDLTRQNEEMLRKVNDMDKRLQMHVVLMDGFVGFMREVKQGQAELAIAREFGGVHLQEVKELANSSVGIQQSLEPAPPSSRDDTSDEQRSVRFEEEEIRPIVEELFDQLPPTPIIDEAPRMSTGRRAPKRKNPPLKLDRQIKRRTRADVRSVRLRGRAWTPINAGHESERGEDDQDYSPDAEDEEDEPPIVTRASPSPSPSESDIEKPRYTVSRSVAPRHAQGPPGKPFKYHRMPKTVAAVWQEWKIGSYGNPAIEELEAKYNTTWRMGTLQERKYASNHVGVRQKIVRKVEDMCEELGIQTEEACEMLDRRVDGRMQLLMTALRKGEDPLVVIPRR